MTKMGRPIKPDAEKRKIQFKIMVTDAERRALDKFAKSKRLETSTWARAVLLDLAGFRK